MWRGVLTASVVLRSSPLLWYEILIEKYHFRKLFELFKVKAYLISSEILNIT